MPQLGILLDDVDWHEMRHSGMVKEFQLGEQTIVILYRPNRKPSIFGLKKKTTSPHRTTGVFECSECKALLTSKPAIGVHARYTHPGKKVHAVLIPPKPATSPKKEK